MDSISKVAMGGGGVAGTLAVISSARNDQGLRWGSAAATLEHAATGAEEAAVRAAGDPGAVERGAGFMPPRAASWTYLADRISGVGGSSLPRVYLGVTPMDAAAAAPLRRAGAMSIEDGIVELRSAAAHATELEASSMHGSKVALVAAGAVAASAGALWLGHQLFG